MDKGKVLAAGDEVVWLDDNGRVERSGVVTGPGTHRFQVMVRWAGEREDRVYPKHTLARPWEVEG